eukprot:evm.model.scf_316.1 EVM.evm.TU.scf_316.1   scf_316:5447-7886(-)
MPPKGARAPDASLHADAQTAQSVLDPNYWRRVCPSLHVDDAALQASAAPLPADPIGCANLRQRINLDGYAQISAADLPWSSGVGPMADGVAQLQAQGWPPSFVAIFDEAWLMASEISAIIEAATGNKINMDVLGWSVLPPQCGFSPHRDRQPERPAESFREDGTPMYSTCWVALTDACPDNSCLYIIPRGADPGYLEGDDPDGDPLAACLPTKEAYQDIRALPAEAGSAILFTHRAIHWGSRGRAGYTKPRVSLSFGCSDDSFEAAYFSRDDLPFPNLKLRAALMCGQMIAYHERFPCSPARLMLYMKVFEQEQSSFTGSYCQQIRREFVAATKEVQGIPKGHPTGLGDALEDDVLDKALDVMLDGALDGGDDFDDDFDDFCEAADVGDDAGPSRPCVTDEGDEEEEEDAEGQWALETAEVAVHPVPVVEH